MSQHVLMGNPLFDSLDPKQLSFSTPQRQFGK